MISIAVERTRDGLTFRDAIVLSEDQTVTAEWIETEADRRFEAWWAAVTAPEVPTDG